MSDTDTTATWQNLLYEPGPFTAADDTLIGNVDIFDRMYIAMNVTIHSFPNSSDEYHNLFQCGNITSVRMPLVAIHYTANDPTGTYPGFHIRWSTESQYNYPLGTSMGGALVKDHPYRIEMYISQDWFHVEIDGEKVYSEEKSRHNLHQNTDCWVRAPYWGSPKEPNATVSDIYIATGNTHIFGIFSEPSC